MVLELGTLRKVDQKDTSESRSEGHFGKYIRRTLRKVDQKDTSESISEGHFRK